MHWSLVIGLFLSLCLHVVDQATDVFAAFLFYLEDNTSCAIATLALVFLPGLVMALREVRGFCSGKGNFFKAVGYLFLSPLWAIVLHLYSLCDQSYARKALFFKTLEGFLEAGPQLALQLSLLFRGTVTNTTRIALDPLLSDNVTDSEALVIFGREYDPASRFWFGWVHTMSVALSFVSIFTSCVYFNDIEEQAGSKAKICFSVPFFFFTLVFRAGVMALIICFLEMWSAIIIFLLFFINVLSALFIGDSFGRSVHYGLWSLFVPVGYSRDPIMPLGYKEVPVLDEPLSDKDIDRSQVRAKYFLTSHILSSFFILGTSLLVLTVLVQSYPVYYQLNSEAIFDLELLSLVFVPVLGISLGLSVLLVRPYYRFDCSGGESPRGNAIV